MLQEAKDTVAVLSYHCLGYNDLFTTAKTTARTTYYGVTSTPSIYCDGTNLGSGNVDCRTAFNSRKVIPPALTIQLTGYYNQGAKTGNIKAHITNTSGVAISGILQFVITETNISHSWETETMLYDVVRDMLPDQNGTLTSIPADSSVDKNTNFTIDSSWNAGNCDIVAFIQGATEEIYQCAKVDIMSIGTEENTKLPSVFTLSRPTPNPAFTYTKVEYSIPNKTSLSLQLFDLTGRLVKTFYSGEQSAGNHTVLLNLSGLNKGIYFVTLKSELSTETQKLTNLK